MISFYIKRRIVMKTIKIILFGVLSILISVSICLTCFAYTDRQNSWLTLLGTVIDENIGMAPLGDYSCSFTLNTSTGKMTYALNIDPPHINPASYSRSRLVYKLKRLNMNYNELYSYYETYYLPYASGSPDFAAYYYAFITDSSNANSFTTLKNYNGTNSSSTTSVADNVTMSINRFYYYDIDLSSSFKTLYYGEVNYDIVCIPLGAYSNFHYYY